MSQAMCKIFFIVAVFLRSTAAQVLPDEDGCGRPVKEKAPWYHTTDEISSGLRSLVESCPKDARGAQLEISTKTGYATSGDEVQMDVLHVRRPGPKTKAKAMYVFGEHARELVTVESALVFVQALCGQGMNAEDADKALEHMDFLIVPNANPNGRKQVEAGHYCKRTNEDGVDLNRNWYDARQPSAHEADGDEQNPGRFGFSEPETQILKSLAEDEKPSLYLSVHSGAYLLGAPDDDGTSFLQGKDTTVGILKTISSKFCGGDCPYGRTTDVLGYGMDGDDTTYITKAFGLPYSFTFEIYSGQTRANSMWTRQEHAQRVSSFRKRRKISSGSRISLRRRRQAWRRFERTLGRLLSDRCVAVRRPTSQSTSE